MVIKPLFPPELVDAIIDHLHDDKQALQQCSLVAKSWEPSSTLHLFSTLSWPPCYHRWPSYHLRRPGDDDIDTSCRCEYPASDFDALINVVTSTPRIQANVRHLRLSSWFKIPGEDVGHPGQMQNVSLPLFASILEAIPRLNLLELSDCSPNSQIRAPGDLSADGGARLLRIPELHLSVGVPMLPVLDTLTLFERVDRLVINGVATSLVSMYNLPRLGPPTVVGALELRASMFGAHAILARSLCTLVDATQLRVLQFDDFMPSEFDPLLRTVAALETFSYHVADDTPAIPSPANLRSLNISGRLELGENGRTQWGNILRDLDLFAHGQLTELGVTLRVFEEVPLEAEDNLLDGELALQSLQETLLRQDWSTLKTITKQCPLLCELKIQIELHDIIGPAGLTPPSLAGNFDRCGDIVYGVLQGIFAASKVPWSLELEDRSSSSF